jgi:coproporphyrinogen III oxidase
MRLMRGRVFEKVGVNVSHVWGTLQPQFKTQIPGAEESQGELSGLRHFARRAHGEPARAGGAHESALPVKTSRAWFGGGSDLTPTFPNAEDTAAVSRGAARRL